MSVVGSGSAPPGIGGGSPEPKGLLVSDNAEPQVLPFALECGRQKVLICVAVGCSPDPAESSKASTGVFLGVSMGAVKAAKEGYYLGPK